jgi:monoamine oxidase
VTNPSWDVVIVGAGPAGLTAARELTRAGRRVCVIEARDRIGGRISTLHHPLSPVPLELGAEFVHGRPEEIWALLRDQSLSPYETGGEDVHLESGEPVDESLGQDFGQVLEDIENYHGPDIPFSAFLNHSHYSLEARHWATAFVEGFNAARKDVIGIATLAEDARASSAIGGDSSFRIAQGYDALLRSLIPETLMLSTVLERVEWEPGRARLHCRSTLDGRTQVLEAPQAVITVPLGVLQAEPGSPGAIQFAPEPLRILESARVLEFGPVVRVSLCFERAFWRDRKELADAGFIHTDEALFPTWWSALPMEVPVITGWSAGPNADALLGEPRATVISKAIETLARISRCIPARLVAAAYHDWQADPFARGAYSYVPAGQLLSRHALAEPVKNTLYFAGEATDTGGHTGTVHGAIASGVRVAKQLLG